LGALSVWLPKISHETPDEPNRGDGVKLDLSMILCGTFPEKQNDKVEEPDPAPIPTAAASQSTPAPKPGVPIVVILALYVFHIS
jgi:hypothetical protein